MTGLRPGPVADPVEESPTLPALRPYQRAAVVGAGGGAMSLDDTTQDRCPGAATLTSAAALAEREQLLKPRRAR